jgi:hypothetical protein
MRSIIPSSDSVPFGVRLDRQMLAELREHAARDRRSVSNLINLALEDWLAQRGALVGGAAENQGVHP